MTQSHSLPIADGPAPEGSRFARAHHILLAFAGLVVLFWFLSGFYQVKSDEVVIIERLGQYLENPDGKANIVEHGLHWHIPWPIDSIHRVSIIRSRILDVKAFNEAPDAYAAIRADLIRQQYPPAIISSILDPYLITGDANVVHMQIKVTYNIDDPEAWLKTVAHAATDSDDLAGQREQMFQEMAMHAMSRQLAGANINDVMFEGQTKLPQILNESIADAMSLPDLGDPSGKSRIKLGIRVQKVDVPVTRPPDRVKAAFEAVGQAKNQAQIAITQATTAAETAKLQAHAQIENLQRDAEAYRDQVVAAATGEAGRFAAVYEQFKIAPDVTRYNLYTEAVTPVSANANRIIFAQPGQRVLLTIDPIQYDASRPGPK